MPFHGTPPCPLGKALRKIRRRLDLNQIEFADALGWSQGTVSSYESGRVDPNPARLLALLKLAASDTEREPILRLLRKAGIDPLDLVVAKPDPQPAAASAETGVVA